MSTTTNKTVAGHYVIKEKIGEGAMGDVYLAIDDRLDREVAVKQLKLEADTEEGRQQYIQRFKQEAKTIARLNHPNIVGIFDIHSSQDEFYMVMEYVNGRNLQEIMEGAQQPLPVETVTRIAIQLCEALQQAHEHNIVHRDIKPANVLVSTRNEVKLTDFGIARLNEKHDLRMTQAGTMLGSFLYASPEQLTNASNVDARADIYSVGATIYELLTGKPVYEADNVGSLIQQVFMSEPIAPHIANPAVSENFSAIILTCLAKQIGQRYQDMETLLTDLYKLTGDSQNKIRLDLGDQQDSTRSLGDTRTSQLRLSLLKTTTQSGAGSVFKYLKGDYNWLLLLLQKYEKLPGQGTYAEAKKQIRQADIRGQLFSGVLVFQDSFVFVKAGELCGALNTAESLVNDAALERLPDSAPLIYTYVLSENLIATVSSFIANSGTPVQEHMDSAVVNLYPILEDLNSDLEQFNGYVIGSYFDLASLEQEENEETEVLVSFYNMGKVEFSFLLNKERQLQLDDVDLRQLLSKGRCLLSLYTPAHELLNTVMHDFLSQAFLRPAYIDEAEGSLADVLMLDSGDMSHCLSEAIGENLTFNIQSHDGIAFPEPLLETLRQRREYLCAHWIQSELFFSINAMNQINAFKQLYPKFPQIDRIKLYEEIPGEYGCGVQYTLSAYAYGSESPVWVAMIGNGDPTEIELFIEETQSVKRGLAQNGEDHLLGAFYISTEAMNNQASALFAKNTQKVGLFNKQQGWVKAGKSGFHFFLAESSGEQRPHLIAPNLI